MYGWTFALGRVAQNYFERRRLGLPDSERQRAVVVQEAKQQSRRVLPSAQDFTDLASELRRRAETRGPGSGPNGPN